MALLVFSVMPAVFGISAGGPIEVDIGTLDVDPYIWLCNDRVVEDDTGEWGRMSEGGETLYERVNNYAFEGEQIEWTVLVMDKNKIGNVEGVYAIIGTDQDSDDETQIQCEPYDYKDYVAEECNAKIDQLDLTEERIDPNTQQYYRCVLTIPNTEPDEYWVSIEAIDETTGNAVVIDENEYWYLNPVVSIAMDGDIIFDDVMPGTDSYSDTFTVENDAAPESGVLLDVFISGTDFTGGTGSLCLNPITGEQTNTLILGDGDSDCDSTDPFCYYAVNGAYSTQTDLRNDAEGYVGVNHGTSFGNSLLYGDFYGASNGDSEGYEIMQVPDITGPYFPGNILNPGTEISITFRLRMPEPCMGNFDSGNIFIWGEAI